MNLIVVSESTRDTVPSTVKQICAHHLVSGREGGYGRHARGLLFDRRISDYWQKSFRND
jgi:hypothetical protein